MPKRRPDHIPTRTCAVCRSARPKREMDRMVRSSDGSVFRDETGKAPGRGTYVCHEPACQDPERVTAAVKRALGAEPTRDRARGELNAAT